MRGDARQVPVKGRIEAGDLRHGGDLGGDGFNERDCLGEMLRGEVDDVAQIGEQRGVDKLRIKVKRAPVHDAMADGGQVLQPVAAAEGFEKFPDRRGVIGGSDLRVGVLAAGWCDGQVRILCANSGDRAPEQSPGCLGMKGRGEKGEFYA